MCDRYPLVTVVTCEVDDGLNVNKWIIPGIGDFGDRCKHLFCCSGVSP